MGLYSVMNTAKWALLSQQTAIDVTGQNIANVNNPDYNRQEVMMESQTPVNEGRFFLGRGVRIAGVERKFDQYLFSQRLENNFLFSRWEVRETVLGRLDILLNESDGSGINSLMGELFDSFYDLSNSPSGSTERTAVVEKAKTLAQQVSYTAGELKRIRTDTNRQITGAVPTINGITSEIAQLNKLIHETESGGATANDYRDARDALLGRLSGLVDATYFEQSNGEIVVMLRSGRSLVVGSSNFTLSAQTNPMDPRVSSIMWSDAGGNATDITSEITSGKLGALLELRDTDILNFLGELDTLAASIIKEVNKLHATGYGLDGSTGVDFFTSLTPGGRAYSTNSGTGVLGTGSVTNPEIVDLDRFRITFDGAGNYTVFNIDENAASGTYSFTSGAPMTFFQQHGFDIAITGTPAAGDAFEISAAYDAAYNMSVAAGVQNNTSLVAAGTTSQSGDGGQAGKIAGLQYANAIGGAFNAASGLYTFSDFLGALVGEVGSATQTAQNRRDIQEDVTNQLGNLREQISGVSLDEEMINLIKFQRAYEAAAKMITTIDDMLQTLLNIR
ncbi:MAG: flagellar hook-associated protein 1 [bacterium]|nr:MAG: flagellar hook-associated protein 1 [bacterium]